MARNLYRLWLVLIILSGSIALWFTGISVHAIWKFLRLNAQVPVTINQLHVRELGASRFAIEIDFMYKIKNETHSGKTILETPQFMNQFAAENYAKLLTPKRWQAWYRQSNPSVSSLEREFPQKLCMQALLTVGVFAYFYFARNALTKLIN